MRFLPGLLLGAFLLAVLVLAVLPVWVLYVLAVMAGALVLVGFVSLLALACRPALRVLHEHRQAEAQRRVMLLQARAQVLELKARAAGSGTSASPRTVEPTPYGLGYQAVKGRVTALLCQGYTVHKCVVTIWGFNSGRRYQAAHKLVSDISAELKVLPDAPPPAVLAQGTQVVAYAADTPASTRGTQARKAKAE